MHSYTLGCYLHRVAEKHEKKLIFKQRQAAQNKFWDFGVKVKKDIKQKKKKRCKETH